MTVYLIFESLDLFAKTIVWFRLLRTNCPKNWVNLFLFVFIFWIGKYKLGSGNHKANSQNRIYCSIDHCVD